ncbi:RraA family protein [Rubinisphaera sp.]|uniref:RraA family protein n=1 Tax=Rubinisphaera sp. TaxID=2024857 RepID=UPI000C0C80E5|nr:RraA family protein [Rubinisphaera sp.]MBV08712.1 dimethylmenaquinone methyltransferase [Rubinisphaera sp.]HCS51612.1 dimethylmenaquinone methyltransferase [Planctomycetaceae bacterium]|tara:strand:+ start:8443 stop:9084 length:642 start_codon:yes stop_codon:yes gene_type:complete
MISQNSELLYSAVVSDALDAMGHFNQCAKPGLSALTVSRKLIGRCRTTLWADLFHKDPAPYEKELQAVDSLTAGDVVIAAAHGSMRSGIWGELLTTAATNRGCLGAVIEGAIRDVSKMREYDFPVYALGACPLDSQNRQRVCDVDVSVELCGVIVNSGDLIVADEDGIVFVPQAVEEEVIQFALNKINDENQVRDAIRNGMLATEAYAQFGVL